MLAPDLTSADFVSALQTLLPTGRAWSKDPGAVPTKTLQGLAPTFSRQTARSNNLLIDGFPATANELLPDWESSLGLPDPCAGESPTLQLRRAQVVARFANTGGQSAAYFTQFALALGYDVTIQAYVPARAGQARCGDPCYGVPWAHAWAVELPLNTVTRARAGQSTAGEPLASWGNAVLQCEFAAFKPAQTTLLFKYTTEIFDNSVVDDFGDPVITDTGLPIIV